MTTEQADAIRSRFVHLVQRASLGQLLKAQRYALARNDLHAEIALPLIEAEISHRTLPAAVTKSLEEKLHLAEHMHAAGLLQGLPSLTEEHMARADTSVISKLFAMETDQLIILAKQLAQEMLEHACDERGRVATEVNAHVQYELVERLGYDECMKLYEAIWEAEGP